MLFDLPQITCVCVLRTWIPARKFEITSCIFARLDTIRWADVVIAIAGIEGALPSVLGGLVANPLNAVPTSVGYGIGLSGLVAMGAMLNACAPGVTVVNIDNGFGAAYAAANIHKAVRLIR